MPDRNGTAAVNMHEHSEHNGDAGSLLGVDFFNRDLQLLNAVCELRRKRFIDLPMLSAMCSTLYSNKLTSNTSMSSFESPY